MFPPETSAVAYVLAALDLAVSLVASAHVLLFKRDTKAAAGWIGLIWLSPLLGAVLYLLLGVNRLQRKAKSLRSRFHHPASPGTPGRVVDPWPALGPEAGHLSMLGHLVGQIVRTPLTAGNAVELLVDGDETYPAMIRAIDGATRSVALATYIFDHDQAGKSFIAALARAVGRGVDVRVLIDDFGARHRWPSAVRAIRGAGVPVARFLPALAPGWFPHWNLRNHRKILVVDDREAFTGGMNILEDYLLGARPRSPKRDLHFRVSGPAVAGLSQVFEEDWAFATGEPIRGGCRESPAERPGGTCVRAVTDGPDDDNDILLKVLLGALACARSSVAIITPYFLPDSRLVAALETAALRGVQVDILLPGRNNHMLVQWASTTTVLEVLEGRCRVWASPPPFDHTKLMVVDRAWSFIGSANWDPRSLRLNFELNLECYGPDLAARLDDLFRDRLRDATPVTIEQITRRGLAARLRDGAARLLIPYL